MMNTFYLIHYQHLAIEDCTFTVRFQVIEKLYVSLLQINYCRFIGKHLAMPLQSP